MQLNHTIVSARDREVSAKRVSLDFIDNDGGRGVYFEDPDGHFLEILARPYGRGD